MQEEFEKRVQERVHTFGLQPSPQVWDDINAVLGKKKHRRVFIGWWILLGLVVAGGGILFYQKDNILRNELNQHPVPATDTLQQNNFAQQAPAAPGGGKKSTGENGLPNIDVITPQPGIQTEQGVANQQQKFTNAGVKPNAVQPYKNNNQLSVKATKNIAIHNGSITTQATSTQINPQNGAKQGGNKPAQTLNDAPIPNTSANEVMPGKAQQPSVTENEKQGLQNPQPQKAVVTTETPPRPQPAGAGKKITPKTIASRHQWFFTVGGGTTQTASGNTGGNEDKTYVGNAAANLLALTAPAAYAYSLSKPITGWHATAGLAYQYKLSTHVRVTAGVQAAYLTNTQKTGSLVKNTFYVSSDYNSGVAGVAAGRGTLQSSYYLASSRGDEYTVVNKAWQLQVPVNVSYIINPHAKTKLMVNAGASYAYTLSSAWLIPDSRYEKLYYNKTLLNNHIISWQAGPAIEFKNNITLGLQYQQSFTTFAKGYIPPKMHWQNISVNAAIPFTIKFKKGKK